MKKRIEIINGRKLYLVDDSARVDIGLPIQDILDKPYQILIGSLDGIFITVLAGNKCYMWRKAEGWREV